MNTHVNTSSSEENSHSLEDGAAPALSHEQELIKPMIEVNEILKPYDGGLCFNSQIPFGET